MSPISTSERPTRLVIPFALLLLGAALATAAEPDILNDQQHFAREIYQELVLINTTASVGDTYQAAQAMASTFVSNLIIAISSMHSSRSTRVVA